jgi:nucleoid-associated protein YgaU
MKLLPWMVILLFSLIGCSGSKSAQPVSQETPQIELSDADEFIENPNDEPAADSYAKAAPEPSVEPSNEPVIVDAPVEQAPAPTSAPAVFADSEQKIYKVQKNETLMIVAFKIYGDYEKWKLIANQNKDTLKGSTNVKEGMSLRYIAPAEEFIWNPQGNPYLIRTGDTLGKISTNVYNTDKRWKLIWNNNKPLIKDPNKIFAGFTIFTPENGRDVASEI